MITKIFVLIVLLIGSFQLTNKKTKVTEYSSSGHYSHILFN